MDWGRKYRNIKASLSRQQIYCSLNVITTSTQWSSVFVTVCFFFLIWHLLQIKANKQKDIRLCSSHEAIFTDSITHCLCHQRLWCLHPGNCKQTQHPLFESTSNLPPPNCRRKKNPKLLTKWDHLEAVVGWWGWRPKRLWGVVGEKADIEREKERQWSSYVYQTMSWVPLCRQDANYRAQREKAWLGRKAKILRLLGCRPWVLNITATLTSPSYSTGHESRVPDHCNDTQSWVRGSHECRQRHRLVQVRPGRPAQVCTSQRPHRASESVTQATRRLIFWDIMCDIYTLWGKSAQCRRLSFLICTQPTFLCNKRQTKLRL